MNSIIKAASSGEYLLVPMRRVGEEGSEFWLAIVDYEGMYEVSNLGRVKSLDRVDSRGWAIKGRIMKMFLNRAGYFKVQLFCNGKPSTRLVSRLVAQAFISNPENKPTVNHLNGNKASNVVENLEWATHEENSKHAVATGLRPPNRGIKNGQSKLTPALIHRARTLNEVGHGQRKIAKLFGVSKSCIASALKGTNWKHLVVSELSHLVI